jgi:hypothetical protein
VIVEHFRRHVAKELDGKAKAMIVTQSREHALRYWQRLNKAELSNMASASSFLSLPFSSSSAFSRFASLTSMPPYLAFHL